MSLYDKIGEKIAADWAVISDPMFWLIVGGIIVVGIIGIQLARKL
jgi:hypothetical protein